MQGASIDPSFLNPELKLSAEARKKLQEIYEKRFGDDLLNISEDIGKSLADKDFLAVAFILEALRAIMFRALELMEKEQVNMN